MEHTSESKKKLIRDIVLVAVLLALAGVLLLAVSLTKRKGAYVEVKEDGVVVGTYSLDTPRTVALGGGSNVLVIEGGVAYLSYADCPDHTCVNTGKISYRGQTIVCLPNRITITVVSEDAGGVDLVS